MNVAILIGRLTDNPELRHTTSNIAVTRFSIAVDRRFTKAGEERATDFINIVAWRQQAEFICNYFKKGQRIAVEGSIQTGRYQDKDGNNRYTFEVVANNVHFVEPKSSNSDNAGYSASKQEAAPQSFSNSDLGDFAEIASDDDLPF